MTGNSTASKESSQIPVPVEIVSEEEMTLIEAALSLARPSGPLLLRPRLGRASASPKRALSTPPSLGGGGGGGGGRDVEDLGRPDGPGPKGRMMTTKKKRKAAAQSLLGRFRRSNGLYVTDLTSTEWCEKQMEFILLFGKPDITDAMKAGITRHAKLEEEVIKKVDVKVESREDKWALRLMYFITCANQLLFEGLTREVPVFGFVQGAWMVGMIDELRMPLTGEVRNLTLVDTKTRVQPRLPAEPQSRNGRLQLMCYKYLWDNLVSECFPSEQFFDFFSLDSHHELSDEIKKAMAGTDFSAQTLGEVVRYFTNFCSVLPRAHNQLLLRYELQEDNSLIGEDKFAYDDDWLKAQIRSCLEFWQGDREANYVPPEEQWKCRFCQFASICPSKTEPFSPMSSQSQG